MKNKVINREQSIEEFFAITQKFMRPRPAKDSIELEYEACLEAIEDGRLRFEDDGTPILNLVEPIKNDEGEISVSELRFKTRVKPSDRANLAKGIDLKTNAPKFALNMTAHVSGIGTAAMLDKLSKDDLWVVENLSPVFF